MLASKTIISEAVKGRIDWMEKTGQNKWWQGSWTIPVSLMLHVLLGATYLLSSGYSPAPAEPETVSVEMVEPPKPEPPPKPEEKKAEEPPPPAQEKPKEPPPVPAPEPEPPPSVMSGVPVRPSPTQMDERDEQGEEEAGGQDQKAPEKQAETQPTTPASAEPVETNERPQAPDAQTNAEQSEILSGDAPKQPDPAAVVSQVPKPEPKPAQEQSATAKPDGEGDPNLKPAKKILAGAKRPGPMMRQIFGNLPPRQRVRQLCFAEVVAQVTAARQGQPPDGQQDVERMIVDNVLNAKGAFNVGTQWFPINYQCKVDIENYVVTEFRYDIGARLTPEDVKRLKLVVQ
ncbi:DUF930 domain-containing protein [Rhizobium skierniewicense]|uniref:DUF930 domain-containing protein n=1 Tax=Rhizobium skierniewicense TaxID=984260 RepID=UPI0015725E7A|nr:DUF930 domain-containing protein [Rhizobium skierniewicense]NTF32508.1 DUF930 domain-containing protein [Rhizobium skierniewicense]